MDIKIQGYISILESEVHELYLEVFNNLDDEELIKEKIKEIEKAISRIKSQFFQSL